MNVKSFSILWFLFFVTSNCFSATYLSQEECEEKAQQRCSFVMCDYVPAGKTFEEVCGKDFQEGWAPSPHLLQISSEETAEVLAVMLTIKAPFSEAALTILGDGRFNYQAVDQNGKEVAEDGAFTEGQMLELTNFFNEKSFFSMSSQLDHGDGVQDSSEYTIGLKVRTFQPGSRQKTIFEGIRSRSCRQDDCPAGFNEIKSMIIKYFGKDFLEIGV